METQLPKIIVENMKPDDLQWAVEVACVNMLMEEVGRPEMVNIEALYKVADLLDSTETVFICKVDGKPVGIIAGILTPHIFNPDITVLAELVWYVLPEYRDSRVGALLLKTFMDKGDEVADETTLCLLHTSPIKVKTLENRGFHLRD